MIRTKKTHLPVAAITNEGKRGKNNEDRYAISSFKLDSIHGSLPVLLAVVSDGVGGHRAGEVASEMTVNIFTDVVQKSDGRDPQAALSLAVKTASNQIFSLGQTTGDFEGMGATVASILIIGHRLYSATVGDSRIYLMHNGAAQQLSVDHTWVQEALNAGLITPAEADSHPNQHVIRRYLGYSKPPEADVRMRLSANETDLQSVNNQGLLLFKGDSILLCSDGLSDLVTAEEMYAFLNAHPLESALNALVALANSRGGHDNITISVVQVPENELFFEPFLTPRNITLALIGLSGVITLFLILIAGRLLWELLASKNPAGTTSPARFIQETFSPQKLTEHPQPTITLDPKFSFDRLLESTQTSTSPFHIFIENENTLTPWPTNTRLPSATPFPITLTVSSPGILSTEGKLP